jgi:hypothetical protein
MFTTYHNPYNMWVTAANFSNSPFIIFNYLQKCVKEEFKIVYQDMAHVNESAV